MKKTYNASLVIYENEGKFETSVSLLANDIEALRSINMFEGRNFVAVVPITFDYDKDAEKVTGMEHYANMKLAYKIPCRKPDGTYYTEEESKQHEEALAALAALDKTD